MSLFRNVLIFALLGFLVGVGAGVGYSYYRRSTPPTGISDTQVMTLTCVPGAQPMVVVAWPKKLTPAVDILERKVGDGLWIRVLRSTDKPDPLGYDDTDVDFGNTYQYRLSYTVGGTPDVSAISVTTENCTEKSQP